MRGGGFFARGVLTLGAAGVFTLRCFLGGAAPTASSETGASICSIRSDCSRSARRSRIQPAITAYVLLEKLRDEVAASVFECRFQERCRRFHGAGQPIEALPAAVSLCSNPAPDGASA